MRRTFAFAAVLVAGLAMPARADDTATLANVLALEQLVDVGQTRAMLAKVDCVPAGCWHPFVEADPLARPFVHSLSTSLLAAAALNVGARELGDHVPATRFLLGAAVTLYPLLLAHNARVNATFSFKP